MRRESVAQRGAISRYGEVRPLDTAVPRNDHGAMSGASPLPRAGEVFFDARGEDRALRLSRHQGAGVVVISCWRSGVCTGTFRLTDADLPAFLAALTGFGAAGPEPAERRTAHRPPPGSAAPDRRVYPVTDEHPLPRLP